jgi:iron complex transport system substrate-binding protein
MKNIKILIIVFLAVLFASCEKNKNENSARELTVKDDMGNLVKFEAQPRRIISLAPSLTEMVFSLGKGKYIAGNTLFCNKPDSAKNITKVGDLLNADCEKIVSLKPDIILFTVEGNQKNTYERLKALGLKTFISNPRTFEGIKKTYSDLGVILHAENKAKNEIRRWDSTLAVLKKQFEQFKNKNVLFLVSVNPIMAAGKNTYLHELIQSAEMNNLAAGQPFNYPVLSRENVMKMDPDYIFVAGMGKEFKTDLKSLYPEWSELKAVKNKHIIYLDPDLYMRPGPNFIGALSDLLTNLRRPGGLQSQY